MGHSMVFHMECQWRCPMLFTLDFVIKLLPSLWLSSCTVLYLIKFLVYYLIKFLVYYLIKFPVYYLIKFLVDYLIKFLADYLIKVMPDYVIKHLLSYLLKPLVDRCPMESLLMDLTPVVVQLRPKSMELVRNLPAEVLNDNNRR